MIILRMIFTKKIHVYFLETGTNSHLLRVRRRNAVICLWDLHDRYIFQYSCNIHINCTGIWHQQTGVIIWNEIDKNQCATFINVPLNLEICLFRLRCKTTKYSSLQCNTGRCNATQCNYGSWCMVHCGVKWHMLSCAALDVWTYKAMQRSAM